MIYFHNKKTFFLYGILFGVFCACYYNTFIWMEYRFSMQDSYYSHGYLIPFICIYFLYLKKDEIKKMEVASDRLGLVIIFITLVAHILGVLSDINTISGFSIFFYLMGSSLYLLGRNITRAAAFPFFLLLFMLPVPGDFINFLGMPTKSLATNVGLSLVDLIGIPNYREGFRIFIPETVLVVGTPCNGMKSLISFTALGVIAAYMSQLKRWKAVVFFILIYPLSVVLNGIRITALVFIAHNYGIEKASPESYLHDISGLVVFVVGLVILFAVIGFWSKKEQNNMK